MLLICASSLIACSHPAGTTRTAARPETAGPRPQLTPDLVIAKARGATGIQRCYTRYLKHAGGHGRVLVSFTVDTRGHAQDSAASGVPAKLGDCIVAEVARWKFPAPREPQSFAVPIDLVID